MLAFGGAILAGGEVRAATVSVSCPGTAAATDREFTIATDPGSTCFASGTGNISGEDSGANPDPLFALLATGLGPGHILIDKSDDTTSGLFPNGALSGSPSLISGLSGDWSFLLPPGTWTNVVIAFKSGQNQLDPDWAAFLLPDGVTSGTWSISGQNALSHVNLYAQRTTTPIPLPAAGFLLIGALGGLGLVARRRSKPA